jgi:hypothetical protein
MRLDIDIATVLERNRRPFVSCQGAASRGCPREHYVTEGKCMWDAADASVTAIITFVPRIVSEAVRLRCTNRHTNRPALRGKHIAPSLVEAAPMMQTFEIRTY